MAASRSCRAGASRPSATPTASSSSPRICSVSPASTATSSASIRPSRAYSAIRPRPCCRGPPGSSSTPTTALPATRVTRGRRPEGTSCTSSDSCSDGSVRRVEWSARFVPEEQLVYGVGRDVTETRRAADEQAALRRVATLVAKAVARERSSRRWPARCGRSSRPPRRASCASSPMARSPSWAPRRMAPTRRTATSPPRSPARASPPAPPGGRRPDRRRGPPVGRGRRVGGRRVAAPRRRGAARPLHRPRRHGDRERREPRGGRRVSRACRGGRRRAARAGRSRSPRRRTAGTGAHDHHARARGCRIRGG